VYLNQAGIELSELASLSAELISSASVVSMKIMSATNLASLSVAQMNALTAEQVTTIVNSPNFASLASNIRTAFSALNSGQQITTKYGSITTKTSASFKTSYNMKLIALLSGILSLLMCTI
jgi:hypothetical protein